MVKKADKTRQKPTAKALRDAQIVAKAMEGESASAIAAELGIHRTTVTKVLNSEEIKSIARSLESQVAELGQDALDTLMKAVRDYHSEPKNALTASLAVLKTLGAIKDKGEVEVKLPKPFVMELLDGSKLVMGAKESDE